MLINYKKQGVIIKMQNIFAEYAKNVIIFAHENRRNLFEETENECKTWKRGAQSAIRKETWTNEAKKTTNLFSITQMG